MTVKYSQMHYTDIIRIVFHLFLLFHPTSEVLCVLKGSQSDVYNLTNLLGIMTPHESYSDWWDKNRYCVSSLDELVVIYFG